MNTGVVVVTISNQSVHSLKFLSDLFDIIVEGTEGSFLVAV